MRWRPAFSQGEINVADATHDGRFTVRANWREGPPLGSGRTGAPDVRHPHAMAHSMSAEARLMSLMRPTTADLLFEQTRN